MRRCRGSIFSTVRSAPVTRDRRCEPRRRSPGRSATAVAALGNGRRTPPQAAAAQVVGCHLAARARQLAARSGADEDYATRDRRRSPEVVVRVVGAQRRRLPQRRAGRGRADSGTRSQATITRLPATGRARVSGLLARADHRDRVAVGGERQLHAPALAPGREVRGDDLAAVRRGETRPSAIAGAPGMPPASCSRHCSSTPLTASRVKRRARRSHPVIASRRRYGVGARLQPARDPHGPAASAPRGSTAAPARSRSRLVSPRSRPIDWTLPAGAGQLTRAQPRACRRRARARPSRVTPSTW